MLAGFPSAPGSAASRAPRGGSAAMPRTSRPVRGRRDPAVHDADGVVEGEAVEGQCASTARPQRSAATSAAHPALSQEFAPRLAREQHPVLGEQRRADSDHHGELATARARSTRAGLAPRRTIGRRGARCAHMSPSRVLRAPWRGRPPRGRGFLGWRRTMCAGPAERRQGFQDARRARSALARPRGSAAPAMEPRSGVADEGVDHGDRVGVGVTLALRRRAAGPRTACRVSVCESIQMVRRGHSLEGRARPDVFAHGPRPLRRPLCGARRECVDVVRVVCHGPMQAPPLRRLRPHVEMVALVKLLDSRAGSAANTAFASTG